MGDRAVAEDPDRIWRIDKARTPHGSAGTSDRYGFRDICADGLPVWHERHLPTKGRPAQPLLEDPRRGPARPSTWSGPIPA